MEAKNVVEGLSDIAKVASDTIMNQQQKRTPAAGGGYQNELHTATYQLAHGLRKDETRDSSI